MGRAKGREEKIGTVDRYAINRQTDRQTDGQTDRQVNNNHLWPSLCQSNDLHQVSGDVDVQPSTEVPRLQYPCVVITPSAAKRKLGDREGI